MDATEGTCSNAIDRTYAGSTDTINQARVDLVEWLFECGHAAVSADAQLVVSELTSNAVEASPGAPYDVSAWIGTNTVCVSVTNRSSAPLPHEDDWTPESVLAPQGRGLMIVKALSESVNIERTDTETVVSAHLLIQRS